MSDADGNAFKAISLYKVMLRRAAAQTRNFLMQNGSHEQSTDSLLTTISRCIFNQDAEQAKFLVATHPLAALHIRFAEADDRCILSFKNAEIFSSSLCAHRHKCISSQIQS
eukprot:3631747-Karenia_brevis.AAC.1